MKSKKGVSVLQSIKTKIVFVIVLAVLATAALCMWTVIPMVNESQTEITQNYMNGLAELTGEHLDRDIETMGAEAAFTADRLKKAIGDIGVEGMESSYAYVVDANGIMLYHPTAEKIGQPVENDAVKHLLGEMSKGNRPETDVITYLFKDVTKYASYYIGTDMSYVVIITADETDVLNASKKIFIRSVISAIGILIICSAIGLFIAIRIVKPIDRITAIIAQLADLNFKEHEWQTYVNKRKDETGIIGRAIDLLRQELTGITNTITDDSDSLYDAAGSMSNSTQEAALSVEQVEKAIAEIAQGATSQAQETQTATENVILMGNMIEETTVEVENLRNNARAMRDAGNKAINILEELNAINHQTKEAIQTIYEQTNITNVSAMKIKEATDMIRDIAEETNLLSLNASIEAARAGEQGRGFAVVAAQIQKLAEQSNESTRLIDEIINSLIADSEKSVATMEDVKGVIEKQDEHVISTENAFHDVKDGIDKSIEGIRAIITRTEKLDEARVRVVDVVQNLTAIAQENAASAEETSASASEVGAIVENIAGNAKQLNGIAGDMEESVKKFVME